MLREPPRRGAERATGPRRGRFRSRHNIGHRHRNERGDADARLRALFYAQGTWSRFWLRLIDGARVRATVRRSSADPQLGWRGTHVKVALPCAEPRSTETR